jgi:hypothetical protein
VLRWLTFERFIEGLFLVTVGIVACLMPAQSDTWWHLRAGEQTWLAGGVQLHDTFSYTVSGAYWPNQEWLSELLFYALYRAGGLPLLTAFAAAVVTLTWAIVWRLTPGDVRWRALLCVAGAASSASEWSLRPKILTLLLIAVTALLLSRRKYLWLPPIFLIWANLHGGVMLGLIVVLSAVAARWAVERRLPTLETLTALGCVAAASITPLGLSLWTEIPASLGRIHQYGIQEWRPPGLADPLMAPFWIVAAIVVVGTVVVRPQRHVLQWSALALLPFALTAGRNVSAALLLAIPAAAGMIGSRGSRRVPTASAAHPFLNAALLGAVATVALIGIAEAWRAEIPRLQWHPLSKGAMDALASCPDRLYNRYDDGGYVIWFAPTRKVFIDGRQDPYPPDMMLEHMRVERSGDYEPMFQRYSIGCAFLPPQAVVAGRLKAAGWITSYADADWVVLSRPAGRPLL